MGILEHNDRILATHLGNHALGNISLDAMEDGLSIASAIWLNKTKLFANICNLFPDDRRRGVAPT